MANILKVATIIVTYNRLELLKECIESLRSQTRKIDEIFVINNSSTDGTEEWLTLQSDLTVITQPNSGGAGGFYTGIKTAYEKNYDWIWVMDDDGLPLCNALEKLLIHTNETIGVLNSLVVSKLDMNKLTFGLEDYLLKEYYTTIQEIKDLEFITGANFFNGTLISKKTIEKIGYPEPLFFIYGDDTEYHFRIRKSNIIIRTICESIITHPEQQHKYVGKWKFFYRMHEFNLLDVKYFPRNIMAICVIYKEFNYRRLFKHYLYDLFGLMFFQRNFSYTLLYLKSIFLGLKFIKTLKYNKNDHF